MIRAVRRVAPALVLAVLAAAALAAPARAGTFRVSQCADVADGASSPRAVQAELWTVRFGWAAVECGDGARMLRIGTANWRIIDRGTVETDFALPQRMPGTSLRTAWLDWRFNPQAPSTNPAYLFVYAGASVVLTTEPGQGSQPGWPTRRELPAGTRSLSLQIWCSPLNGPGWCNWQGHLLDIRGMTLEAEEYGEPSASASGPLVAGSAHAGVEPLELAASDADSGVRSVAVSLAGIAVGALRPADGCRDDRLPPCPQSLRGTLDVDTRAVPDGSRRLRLVVTDAAGNARTVDAGTVEIHNQAAPGAPGGAPVPDPASAGSAPPVGVGVVGSAPPVGAGVGGPASSTVALFPANPLAGRGHIANGTGADERARVRAWLEPGHDRGGTPLRRRAATVPPGVRVRIRGRLTNRDGRPIGRATLAAVRREDGGVWKAVTGVRTRPNGRFTAFTRIGPSQRIQFVYYAYGDSETGRRSPRLQVRVRRE